MLFGRLGRYLRNNIIDIDSICSDVKYNMEIFAFAFFRYILLVLSVLLNSCNH